jgi:hypothetical protein
MHVVADFFVCVVGFYKMRKKKGRGERKVKKEEETGSGSWNCKRTQKWK